MRLSRNEKTRRATLLAQKDHKCALCGEHQSTVVGMIHAPKQNVMICRNCSQFKSVYLFNLERNCTIASLKAFLKQGPAPEPVPEIKATAKTTTKATAKKLTLHQLDSLQMLLNGQTDLTLAEWCQRAGTTEAEAMQQIADR